MNPTQKSGNFKKRKVRTKPRKGDYRVKKIARQEAKKVVEQRVESKVFDDAQSAFAIDSIASTTIFNLTNGLTRGTGEQQFLGDSIMPTHLRIRMGIEKETSESYNYVRVVLIQNKAGGVPVAGTLWQLTGLNAPYSPFNTSFNETYRVLFDEFYCMTGECQPGNPSLANATSAISIDIRVPSEKLRKMTFTNPPTGTPSISTGGIYLCIISDSLSAPHPNGQFVSRLYFKDA